MSARREILDGKFKTSASGVAAARAAGGDGQMAELFAGFVGYACAHWSYAAQSGAQKAPDLLDGEGTKTVACGTLREALKILVRDELKLTPRNADINERFLTKPSLQCFDSKVKGNVGNHGSTTFDLACHFSTHYFVEVGGKFYDPCLMAVYANGEGPIAHKTSLVRNSNNLRMAGKGRSLVILKMLPGRTVPGFGEVWEILVPAECKQKGVLTAQDLQALKSDPDIVAGQLL
jgi:hypothetical protein